MSRPVVIAENGIGLPVNPVEDHAPSMTIADNGYGEPIVISPLGAPYIVNGLTPAALFRDGSEGLWVDPSDLSTMFQDSAGTTPVTAPGQSVGLMLDKSKGLVLGPELATNGTFDFDILGWDSSNGSYRWEAGGIVGRSSTGTTDVFDQSVLTEIGAFYMIEVDVVSFTLDPEIALDGTIISGTLTAVGKNTAIFRATATSHRIGVIATAADIEFSSISIRELPGNHASQATASKRPTYQTDGTLHYLSFDGVDDYLEAPIAAQGAVGSDNSTGFGIEAISGAANPYLYSGSGDSGILFLLRGGQGLIRPGIRTTVTTEARNGTANILDTPYVVGQDWDRATGGMTGYVNSVDEVSITTTPADKVYGANFAIGGRGVDVPYWKGKIFGGVIIDRLLSEDERARLDGYLAKKSGVTL